ncbi:unnamed protein product [Adineta ricciae]|uniref:G-patch domain-containing protein n=1 Tax=Adineta ricciae TaxID=249248 RepID=A0A814D5V3_ADIRI|nr:unnamed protein product [Adineta ricciae]
MVSLNEKRSKIRYVVQNKTEWVDDGNKFGKRMLEKMGWTSGAGLGKNEDGRTEHVDMKFKANLKGVGFVNGKYDDTWLAHSQSFDNVLEQLQQSHPTSNSSSLHDFNQTVRQTKTRFTYKKQSSGKDLSSRSNHELDCIFGWNKIQQNNASKLEEQVEQEKDSDKEGETQSDNMYVTSKQSINDYFKEKSKKRAMDLVQQIEEASPDEQQPEKKKKKKEESTKQEEKNQANIDLENPYPDSNLLELEGYKGWTIDSSIDKIIKKKEKQKKRKHKSS